MDIQFLQTRLETLIGPVARIKSLGGGCIANASCVETKNERFFLKWGGPEVARTFGAEVAGLKALQEAESPVKIPTVISWDSTSIGFLLLEWVASGPMKAGFSEGFGRALARLHRHEGQSFGFEADNFIGRSPQKNTWHSDWPAFFRYRRLEPQVTMARKSGLWQKSWNPSLDQLYRKLPALLPEKPARSILHGDLWSGNYLITREGRAALFDPACYYGHREADLAMTALFGGFDARFYEAYKEAWPLEPGYEERQEIYNLYHLINHLNLFGESYAGGIGRTLSRYG